MFSHFKTLLFSVLLFVAMSCGSAVAVRADAITSNSVAVIGGSIAANTTNTVSGATFSFVIPAGQTITAATLTGSAQFNLQFGASISLLLDNNSVMTISGVSASLPLNINLSPAIFSTLADGTSILTLSRVGGTFGGNYNLFSLQLNITTGPAAIPEPATLGLLGTSLLGLVGLGKFALKRRHRRH
ncbi:MAG TPA: hypothetical protein VIV66_19505 [Pyrinomonadaceae bacterium]